MACGYGSKRVPDGKLHDLWMKAIALKDLAGNRVVLITSDFQGVPKGMSDPVIGMGAETVVDYALRFKKTYGAGTWVCGYSDDMISYIPSHRVWMEGGYEGGSNLYENGRLAFRWAGDIKDRIAESVHRLVQQVGWEKHK